MIFAGRRREENTREDSPLGQEPGERSTRQAVGQPTPLLQVSQFRLRCSQGCWISAGADLKSCTAQPQPSCSPPSCCSSIFPLRSWPPRCSVQFLGGWGLSLSPSVCLQLVSWKCLPLSHPSLSVSQPQSLADVGLLPRLSRCSGLSSRKPLSAVGSRG